jgi:hypothetical protein
MSVFYLAENWPPEQEEKGARLIALHPRVFDRLTADGPRPEILEDFYSLEEIRSDRDRIFEDQLDWFSKLDLLIQENIPLCGNDGLAIASAHYNRIKYFVDFLIMRARIASLFMERAAPAKVIFLGEAPTVAAEPPSFYDFSRHDRWSYQPVFEQYCLSRPHIPFELQASLTKTMAAPPQDLKSSAFWGRAFAKNVAHFFRYRKWRSLLKRNAGQAYLFLDAGTESIDHIQRALIERGSQLYFDDGRGIIDRSSFCQKRFHPPLQEGENWSWDDLIKAHEAFRRSELFDWQDLHAPFPLTRLAAPYWKYFFFEIIPQTLRHYEGVSEFLRAKKIKAVIARSSSGMNYAAPLLAARARGIPRICFQHSIAALDKPAWIHTELAFFDCNFAQASHSRDHFQHWANTRYAGCKVLESSDYLRGISRKCPAGRRRPADSPVYYVPAKLANGCIQYNNPLYPPAWYYKHQRTLLEYFAGRKDYHFVYKHLNGQRWADESIVPWIQRSNFSNINIKKGPFTSFLKDVSMVIFDYPSTGFFEALAAGIPVLGLFHAAFDIWPPMMEAYAPCLQAFQNPEDAVGKIETFLNTRGAGFSPELSLEHFDSVDYLLNIPQAQAS